MLITAKSICSMCDTLEKKERTSSKSKSDNLSAPAKLNAPIKFTSPERVKLTMQNYRLVNKELKFELFKLKEEIESKSIPVDNEFSDFCTMSDVDKSTVPPFIHSFWEEQQKYISANNKGARYHPMVIRYCLGLASKSPAVYDDIRFDEKPKVAF